MNQSRLHRIHGIDLLDMWRNAFSPAPHQILRPPVRRRGSGATSTRGQEGGRRHGPGGLLRLGRGPLCLGAHLLWGVGRGRWVVRRDLHMPGRWILAIFVARVVCCT